MEHEFEHTVIKCLRWYGSDGCCHPEEMGKGTVTTSPRLHVRKVNWFSYLKIVSILIDARSVVKSAYPESDSLSWKKKKKRARLLIKRFFNVTMDFHLKLCFSVRDAKETGASEAAFYCLERWKHRWQLTPHDFVRWKQLNWLLATVRHLASKITSDGDSGEVCWLNQRCLRREMLWWIGPVAIGACGLPSHLATLTWFTLQL